VDSVQIVVPHGVVEAVGRVGGKRESRAAGVVGAVRIEGEFVRVDDEPEIERAVGSGKAGTITVSEFEERCANLLRRYEEMVSRLDGTYQIPKRKIYEINEEGKK
jgi:hypothetical protein